MIPTQDQIDEAVKYADRAEKRGASSFAQEDNIVLAAAYRSEKARADQNAGAFDAQDYWHKRADLFECQYAELVEWWKGERPIEEYTGDALERRHEAERKALCPST